MTAPSADDRRGEWADGDVVPHGKAGAAMTPSRRLSVRRAAVEVLVVEVVRQRTNNQLNRAGQRRQPTSTGRVRDEWAPMPSLEQVRVVRNDRNPHGVRCGGSNADVWMAAWRPSLPTHARGFPWVCGRRRRGAGCMPGCPSRSIRGGSLVRAGRCGGHAMRGRARWNHAQSGQVRRSAAHGCDRDCPLHRGAVALPRNPVHGVVGEPT